MLVEIITTFTGFPLTWKTPGIYVRPGIFWYNKLIYAGFDTVMAASHTS